MNQNHQHADFVLGTCPDCKKVVRIPVTAVTAQSKSQVRCPICDAEFEIADILDEVIPSVEVVDTSSPPAAASAPSDFRKPERINAIDTPELFHGAKDGYEPKTEKKNGRFVVPDLLSKGSKSSRKKKKSSRRRSRNAKNDPKLAESLAKLKQNASKTSLSPSENVASIDSERTDTEGRERSRSERERTERTVDSSRSRSDRSRSSGRGESRRSREKVRVHRNSGLMAVRSLTELKQWATGQLAGVGRMLKSLRAGDEPNSKLDTVMIGVGVLLAIPMLHLVMWWFVGIDPLGLARPTSYVVPFVVPNEMRPVAEDEKEAEAGQPSLTSRTNSSALNANGNSTFRLEEGKLPTPKIDPSSVHVDEPQ